MTDSPRGRAAETAALTSVASSVLGGRRGVVLLRGEPGIGKTLLLGWFANHLERHGFTVLAGRSTELESDVPLAAVVQALDAGTGSGSASPLGEAHLELTTATRWQRYVAVTAHLDSLAEHRPVALLLDDVHWADPATHELLEHLVRRPPRRPHLIALAARPGEAAQRLVEAQRATGGRAVVLDLAPLDRETADLLVGAGPTDADRQRLYAESAGNPLLLLEMARAGAEVQVPGGVASFVAVEVARAGGQAQAVLRAGSLLGDPFDLDLAAAVAELPWHVASEAAADLERRGLLQPTSHTRLVAFRHPVVRTAVHAAMSSAERLTGHDRAAAALAAAGAPLRDRARHLVHAARQGDLDAAAVLRAAAAEVRLHAPVIAADWLLAARVIDPALTDVDALSLAETLVDAGRLLDAVDVVDLALVSGTQPTSELGVRLVLVAASVERLVGRHDAARRRLARVLREQPPAGPERARLLAHLALSAYESGDLRQMAERANQAADEPDADLVTEAAAAAMQAVTLAFAGHVREGVERAAQAVRAVDLAPDSLLAAQAELLTAVPWGLLALERLTDALVIGRRTSAAARRAGTAAAVVSHDLAVVLTLGLLGRTAECADAADLAEQAARVSGNDQAVQWALWMRAWALLERGDLRTAEAVAAESVALAERLDASWLTTVARAVHGAVLVSAGSPDRGREMLADYDLDPGWVCRWAPYLVQAHLDLGEPQAARDHARHVTSLAAGLALAGPRAAAATRRGDRAAARRRLRRRSHRGERSHHRRRAGRGRPGGCASEAAGRAGTRRLGPRRRDRLPRARPRRRCARRGSPGQRRGGA